MAPIRGHDDQRRALLPRRRRPAWRTRGSLNQQTRVNEAIFIFALSAVAALVQMSSPNILAEHHSKAIDVFVFSILMSFCSTIASMTLPRRQARLIRASGRLAAFSAAVAFSSFMSMVLPHKIWWTAYIACALPLYNLFPGPFVLCFDFFSSCFYSLWRIIAPEIQRLKASPQTQNRSTFSQPINQNVEMLEV